MWYIEGRLEKYVNGSKYIIKLLVPYQPRDAVVIRVARLLLGQG